MVILALKVTLVPTHIVFPGLTDKLMVGTSTGLTVIVRPELVTVEGVAHCALLTRSQVITSPLANAVVV